MPIVSQFVTMGNRKGNRAAAQNAGKESGAQDRAEYGGRAHDTGCFEDPALVLGRVSHPSWEVNNPFDLLISGEHGAADSVKGRVKLNFFKIAGLGVALALSGSVCIIGLHTQHALASPSSSSPVALTTNWVGFLVAGAEDTLDPIAHGPHPTTIRQVQIGLRSDGVVIWRRAAP